MALSDSIGLLFRLKAEDQASKAIKNVEHSVSSLAGVARSAGSGDISGLAASLAGLTGGLSKTQIGAAAAIAGVTALAGAAVGVTKVLFDLAESASEFGSQIYDAQVQTGLSAETLSTLKLTAEQAGTAFDTITKGVSKFAITVGEARDGNEKAIKSLAKFGLTANDVFNDLDGSLGRVIQKIYQTNNPIEKLNLAASVFGARSGKEMLKVVDQLGGDLPKVTAEMKRLGVTISDEAARAADEFDDSVKLLSAQFESFKRTIGFSVMPVFRSAMGEMSRWFAANQQNAKVWGANTSVALMNVLKSMAGIVAFAAEHPTVFGAIGGGITGAAAGALVGGPYGALIGGAAGAIGGGALGNMAELSPADRAKARIMAGDKPADVIKEEKAKFASENAPDYYNRKTQQFEDKPSPFGEKNEPWKARLAQLNEELATIETAVAETRVGMKADREESKAEAARLMKEMGGSAPKGPGGSKTAAANDAAERAKAALKEKLNLDATDYANLISDALEKMQKEVSVKFDAEAKKNGNTVDVIFPSKEEIANAAQAAENEVNLQYSKLRKTIDDQEKADLDDKKLTEQEKTNITHEANQKREQLEKDHQATLTKIREQAADAKRIIVERDAQQTLDAALRELKDQEYIAQQMLDLGEITQDQLDRIMQQSAIDALKAQRIYLNVLLAEENQSAERVKDLRAKLEKLNQDILDAEKRLPNPRGGTPNPAPKTPDNFFGPGWVEGTDKANAKMTAMKGVADMLKGSFQQMAQGVGDLLQQWILTGELGPQAMRKLTASILAGLAAQAAVEALMETARGIADLTSPLTAWRAPLHFKAAAIFAAVAGVAAVAGRAIAGDAFKNQTNSATGQSSSSNRSTSGQGQAYSGQQATTIDGSRNQSGMFRPEIVISDRSGMFSQLFETEIRNNSKVRGLIIETANS